MANWAPLVPIAKARIGVDDGTLGLLLLCLGLGSIVAMPMVGILAGRFGCRAVILASTLVLALVLPLLAVVDSIPGMAIVLALFGASIGAVDVAINIQAVMVEKDSKRNMMSGFHGLFSVGGIVGAGGMSLLLGAGTSPWVATLMFSALLLVLLALSTQGLLPYGNQETEHTPLFTLPRGIVAFIGLLCFLVFLGEGAVLDWSALFLIGTHLVDPAQAGFGYTMFALAMTAGRLTGDWIVRSLGSMKVVVSGGLLAALGFTLTVLAPNQPLAFFGFLLVGLGASNIVPVLFTAAGQQTLMPPSQAIAAITTIGYSGMLVGPATIGFVAKHWNLSAAFVLIGVGMAFVALTWPLTARHRGKR
ncbi:MFS transporter [Allorhizobium sp. Av2]